MDDEFNLGSMLTQSTAFTWCAAQSVIFICLLNWGHHPEIQLYDTHITNLTQPDHRITLIYTDQTQHMTYAQLHDLQSIIIYNIDSRTLFGFISLLTVLYAMATGAVLNERSENIAHQDYTMETMHYALPWDLLFWFEFVMLHHTLFVLLMTPSSLYIAPLIALLSFVSMYMITLPRDPEAKYGFQGGLFFMMYLGAWLTVLSGNQNLDRPYVGTGMMLYFCLDMMLAFGHTWDATIPMQTVINCRLAYISLAMALNMFLFASWPINKGN